MPYKCLNCGARFDEPHIMHTSYEFHYGVASMFPNLTPLELDVCPCCNDEELEEVYEDDEEEDEHGN